MFPEIAYESLDKNNTTTSQEPRDSTAMISDEQEALQEKSTSESNKMFPEIVYESLDKNNTITSQEPGDSTAMKSDEQEDLQEKSNSESTKESIQSSDEMLIRRAESQPVESADGPTDSKTPMTVDGPVDSTSTESDESESEDNASTKSPKPKIIQRIVVKPYLDLHRAAMKGDWGTIRSFLKKDPNAKNADITGYNETMLHVAAWGNRTGVIKELLKILSPEELETQSVLGNTALHIAAMGGNLEIVKSLVEANPKLTQINHFAGSTPLLMAAINSSKEVVPYLCAKTTDDPPGKPFTGPKSINLITALIHSDIYDVAFTLLERYPQMAAGQTDGGSSLLSSLATKPWNFPSGRNYNFWEKWIYRVVPDKRHDDTSHNIPRSDEETTLPQNFEDRKTWLSRQVPIWIKKLPWKIMKELVPRIKQIEQEKLKHMAIEKLIYHACQAISNLEDHDIHTFLTKDFFLRYAAMNGIVEIVTISCKYFPNLLWWKFERNQNIFHIATKHRREKIVNLLYEECAIMKFISTGLDQGTRGTLLHKVAELAPYSQLRSIPCPALQMQREIQWFKGVECLIHPYYRAWLSTKEETADQLFTNEHKDLVKEGEKWMKDTSNSCMLVSTLIATVVFAAAFTVPGGNVDGKGTPIFLEEAIFMIFAISDAIALFSSTTSILMFLSILTARFAEHDFLYALPKRLILGLLSLFIAIVTMMVAFSSALWIMLSERWEWLFTPTLVLGCIPAALFMMLQVPLFFQMIWSTYRPSIFHPQKIW